MFGSICTEIFGTILERFAADLEKESMEVDEKLDGDLQAVGKPLEFDYIAISELLHETAKHETVLSKRRKRIEKLAKQWVFIYYLGFITYLRI